MIVVRQKSLNDIREMIAGHRKVLLIGCNTCAAISLAGGEREVANLVETLRLAMGREDGGNEFEGTVIQRQCEPEFVDESSVDGYDAVLSLGCGAGVAFLAENISVPVYPALDTLFIGAAQGFGVWRAECSACGACVLGETAGVCPMTRCAKGITNGPCGGVSDGRCELGDRECAWVLIHQRRTALNASTPAQAGTPKDHSTKSLCVTWNCAEGSSK